MPGSINVKALRWALLGCATGGVFVVAVVTAVLTTLPLSERLRESAASGIQGIADSSADAIGHIVDGRQKVIRQIASSTAARTLLDDHNSGRIDDDTYISKITPILADAVFTTADVTGIIRIALDGTTAAVGEAFAPELWPSDAETANQVTARGPLDTPFGQRIVVASPVEDKDGTRLGTDIIGLDMAPVAQRVAAHKTEGGGSTRVYLMFEIDTKAFLFLADGSVQRLEDHPFLPSYRRLTTGNPSRDIIDAGEHMVAVAPITVNGWSMVVTQRRDEVFADLNQDISFVVLVVLIMAVVGTGGVYILLRPITGKMMFHTDTLENEVSRATSELNVTMLALADAKAQSDQERDRAHTALEDLRRIQQSLIESEKMASLGSLVAGVAHEINTPVGIVVTSASYLAQQTATLKHLFETENLGVQDMEDYVAAAEEAVQLIETNASRAADLIQSFKQVAVDRTAGEMREIDLKDYVQEILASLRPQLKKLPVDIKVEAPSGLELTTSPGALSQVLTNLVMNSLTHGFDEAGGHIGITITDLGEAVEIVYVDDGKGIAPEHRTKVFDPFFTTRRNTGGSGLGMNIVYNIVTRTLNGRVRLENSAMGVRFVILFPKETQPTVALLHA